MRKKAINQIYNNKQNKYDQTTNLAIDLQSEINKSVIFPKIASKHAESQLIEFISRQKSQEEKVIQNIRNQVDKLRRHVYLLDQKKKLFSHEIQPQLDYQSEFKCRPQVSHHLQYPQWNVRSFKCNDSLRPQINTQKSVMVIKRDSSYRNFIFKNNEVQFEKSIINRVNKQTKESRTIIASNRSIIETEKQKIKKKKQPNSKQARRRLRKCIWAVYFSIFFPSLARKVYINRLKAFMVQYPHDIDKYYTNRKQTVSKIRQDEADLWAEMEDKLDIMNAIEQAKISNIFKDTTQIKQIKVRFQVMLDEELNSSQRSIHKHETFQSQLFSSKNTEYLLIQFSQIFQKLLDNFLNLVNTTDLFSLNWRSYSQGLLTNTFVNNSHPKLLNQLIESGIVRLNHFKQILQIYDQQTQIMLLTFDIFCRIYCYNWFCKLKENIPKYSQQNLLIGNFFITLLYVIGEIMVEDKLKQYLKQKVSFQQPQRKQNKKIRSILPMMLKRKAKNDLKDVNRLIYDPPLWNEMSSLILQNKEVVNKTKVLMMNAGTQVYNVFKEKIKQDLKIFKTKTLEEKYIIKNDKERPENLFEYQEVNFGKRASKQGLNSLSKLKMGIKLNNLKEGK